MCARLLGLINLLSPTRACPVCLILDSPFVVRARSVLPVCRPLSDHSVSPWRMMKTRGVVMVCCNVGDECELSKILDSYHVPQFLQSIRLSTKITLLQDATRIWIIPP